MCSGFPLILLFPLALFQADPMAYARYQTAIVADIALSLLCYLVYPTSFVRPRSAGYPFRPGHEARVSGEL